MYKKIIKISRFCLFYHISGRGGKKTVKWYLKSKQKDRQIDRQTNRQTNKHMDILTYIVHKKGPADDPSNFRMIALSGCIGKTFHLLLADRLTKYLTVNNLIDPTMQKAFLPGINGCIEHNMVLDELIKGAHI